MSFAELFLEHRSFPELPVRDFCKREYYNAAGKDCMPRLVVLDNPIICSLTHFGCIRKDAFSRGSSIMRKSRSVIAALKRRGVHFFYYADNTGRRADRCVIHCSRETHIPDEWRLHKPALVYITFYDIRRYA